MSTHAGSKRLTYRKLWRKAKTRCLFDILSAHTAKLIDPHVDLLLVGDSLGVVMYGMETTLGVTLEMMIAMVRRWCAGLKTRLWSLICRLALMKKARRMRSMLRAIKETGAQAVKRGRHMEATVRHLTERGIPVMGHIGLTPQNNDVMVGLKRKVAASRLASKKMQKRSARGCICHCSGGHGGGTGR